jgi:hypothetical protein
MPTYLSENPLQQAYIGTESLSRIYAGRTKVWPNANELSGSYIVVGQFTTFKSNPVGRVQYIQNKLS